MLVLSLTSSLLAVSIAKATQAATNSAISSKVTIQARQYAETEAELVRSTSYSDLVNKSKASVSGTSFYREVIVGSESSYDNSTNKKECIVNVYNANESLPRASLKVIRLNKGESDSSAVPQGTILSWYGNLNDIPKGFALCNGTNGTPDLRDKFIVGAGSGYNLGNTGGANTVTLSYAQMPSHAHSRGNMNITGTAEWACDDGGSTGCFYKIGYNSHTDSGGQRQQTIGFDASRSWTGVTSYEGSNQPHENRPPYYALFFIMKL